jgi:tetratricopeptide (TPR) repeat protein
MLSAAFNQLDADHEHSDVRRLAELARLAGHGDAPETALKTIRDALCLLDEDAEEPLFADMLRWQGTILRERGQTSAAEPLYRRSLDMARRISYSPGIAHALNCLGSLAQRRGNITTAANLVTDALAIAEQCGDRQLFGILQQNLGMFADIRGNSAAALAHYSVGLRMLEEAQSLEQLPRLLNNLAILHAKEGRHDDARNAFRRALATAKLRHDLDCEGVIEESRAEFELCCDAVDEAYEPLTRAYDIATQRGDDLGRAAALKLRGAYQRLCGRPIEAADTLRYALTLSAIGEDALLGAETLYQFGLALCAAGQRTQARDAWQAALDAFERIAAREWIARVRHRLSVGLTGRYY